MSRIFEDYDAYHPYDAYLHEELNQIWSYYLRIMICKGKDGKASKDHVIQTFWYKSESESESRIFHYPLLSTFWHGEFISL